MDPVSKAIASDQEQIRHDTRFKPGVSGNPGGRPKKREITRIYEKYLAKKVNQKRIIQMIDRVIDRGQMAAILQVREMAERTEGKVAQELQINETLTNLTDAQLAARLVKMDDEIKSRCDKLVEA